MSSREDEKVHCLPACLRPTVSAWLGKPSAFREEEEKEGKERKWAGIMDLLASEICDRATRTKIQAFEALRVAIQNESASFFSSMQARAKKRDKPLVCLSPPLSQRRGKRIKYYFLFFFLQRRRLLPNLAPQAPPPLTLSFQTLESHFLSKLNTLLLFSPWLATRA